MQSHLPIHTHTQLTKSNQKSPKECFFFFQTTTLHLDGDAPPTSPHQPVKPVTECLHRPCAKPQLERSGKRRRIPLNETRLRRIAEVQLRAAAQTGRAINQCRNSASTNTGISLLFITQHTENQLKLCSKKCDSIFDRMESVSHAEMQFHPTENPRRGGETETSACVYFPFQSGCTSSAAEQEDQDGESRWEKEGFSSPPNTLSHSFERKVSSFLSSPTSFFPSFPFHPFAKTVGGKKTYRGMQLGRGEEEEKGGPAASTRRNERLFLPPEWE